MIERLCAFSGKIPAAVVLFLFFFSVYAFTMAGQIQYGDEVEKYRVAQSIVERGEFSIRATVQKNAVGVGGQNYSAYELGQTVFEIPLYAVGTALNSLFPQPDVNAIGQLLVGFLNPLVTALTCVLLFLTGRELGYGQRTTLAVTLAYGLATIAWPFSKGFTREPLLTLFLLGAFSSVVQFQKTKAARWLLLAGIMLGLLSFTKLIQAASIPVFLAYVVFLIHQDQRQAGANVGTEAFALLEGLLIFLLPFLAFLALQSVYSFVRFGTLVSGLGGTTADPITFVLSVLPHSQPGAALLDLLFSPDKSLLVYSPPALLFVVAWFMWLGRDRGLALLLLALVAVAFASVVTRPDWDGGTWWGPRYLVQIIPFFILPLGILASSKLRWLWITLGGVLCVLGWVVQLVGAFANQRDYLDITGSGIALSGQIDFMLHRAIDSLVVYLSPQGLPIQVNPFGITLAVFAGLLGLWIIRRWRQPATEIRSSSRMGLLVLAAALIVEFSTFVLFVVAPYSQVLAAQGNTKFVAGNSFLAAGRTCEASAMYSLAIERGTTFQSEALAKLGALLPRADGTPIGASKLLADEEKSDGAVIEEDGTVTITGEGSLVANAAGQNDVIARGHASPVPVLPHATYEVSGWIRTENIYGEGFGTVSVTEDDGAFHNIRTLDVIDLSETSGWKFFQRTWTTQPTTQRLFIAAGLWKTYGTVWIDGLELSQVTADHPASQPQAVCH